MACHCFSLWISRVILVNQLELTDIYQCTARGPDGGGWDKNLTVFSNHLSLCSKIKLFSLLSAPENSSPSSGTFLKHSLILNALLRVSAIMEGRKSYSARSDAPLHRPFYRTLCGASPSAPLELQFSFVCGFPPFSLRPLSLSCHIQLYISLALMLHIPTMCPGLPLVPQPVISSGLLNL